MRRTYTGVKTGQARGIAFSAGVKEEDFQRQVIDLAQMLGWRVAHFRNVRIQRKDGSVYYACPVQADGEGWPDLVLLKGDRMLIFELKSMEGKVTPAQQEWLEAFSRIPYVEAYVAKPSDLEEITELLR